MNIYNVFTNTKWLQFFDWTPVSVKMPKPLYEKYDDTGKMLLGYEVEVEYLYHGNQRYLFPTDEEKLGLAPRRYALARAVAFYKNTMAKISSYEQRKQK